MVRPRGSRPGTPHVQSRFSNAFRSVASAAGSGCTAASNDPPSARPPAGQAHLPANGASPHRINGTFKSRPSKANTIAATDTRDGHDNTFCGASCSPVRIGRRKLHVASPRPWRIIRRRNSNNPFSRPTG